MTRRSALIVVLLIAAAAGFGWWRFGRGPEVTTVAPSRGTAVEIVYATGAVEPVRWAKVASVIRDRIVEICDCEGRSIAKGDVPVSHWFRLGRALTPVERDSVLVSWSGSMFEYLMPELVMRAPAGSLLEQTSRLVVGRHRRGPVRQ